VIQRVRYRSRPWAAMVPTRRTGTHDWWAVPDDGLMVIRVYDGAGNLFPATGTVTIDSTPPPVVGAGVELHGDGHGHGVRLSWTHSPSRTSRVIGCTGTAGRATSTTAGRTRRSCILQYLHGLDATGGRHVPFGLRAVDRTGRGTEHDRHGFDTVEAFSVTVAWARVRSIGPGYRNHWIGRVRCCSTVCRRSGAGQHSIGDVEDVHVYTDAQEIIGIRSGRSPVRRGVTRSSPWW